MRPADRTQAVALVLLIAGVIPLSASGLVYFFIQWNWQHLALLSAIEAIGAIAAVFLGVLLLFLQRYSREAPHLVWVATAFIGIGILNALHILAPADWTFVWFESIAVFTSGLLFALVWLPAVYSHSSFARALPYLVAAVALAVGLFSLGFPSLLRPMTTDGGFSLIAKLLNLTGGVFLLLAAHWFFQRYLSTGNTDLLLLASFCLLFCSAGILSPLFSLQETLWWFWYVIRLVAYFIVLLYIFIVFVRSHRDLRRANRALKILAECNQAVVKAQNEAELLNEVCRILVEEGGYRLAWVGFAENDPGKSVRPVAQAGFEENYLKTVAITYADTERGRGPTGTAIRTSKAAIARDILTDPKFAPWREEAVKRGYASSIALPLIADGQSFGALNVYATEPDAFDDEEVKILMDLADNLAYGIMALRTRSDRDRTLSEMVLLQQIIGAIVSASDFPSAVAATVRFICEKGGWPCGEAWLLDPDGKKLNLSCVFHIGTPELARFEEISKGLEVAPGQDLPGLVWARKEPVWVRDVTTDTNFYRAAYARDSGLTTGVAVPVLASGEVIAVLEFLLYEAREEDSRFVSLISSVALQLGLFFERKRAEDGLRESEENFRALLESLPVGIFLVDPERRILLVNAGVENLFGYTREELLGRDIQMLLPEQYREVLSRQIADYFAKPRVRPLAVTMELSALRKNGSEVPVEMFLNTVKTRKGTGVICSIVDLTERKEAEARWFGIFENAVFGIYQCTPEGRIVTANPTLARILGYDSPQELMNRVTDVETQLYVNPENRKRLYQMVEIYGALRGFEVAVRRKDGTVTYLSLHGRAVRDPSGKILYLEGFVEDLTAKKQMEAQVAQSQKLEIIGSLAGGIAHDFNNLLQVILGMTELAMEKLPPEHSARQDLQKVFEAGVKATELTRKILTLGRKQVVQVQPVDVNQAVGETVRLLRSLLAEGITLKVALEDGPFVVMMDPVQLDQVVMNLCTNAVQAMPEGGLLVISTKLAEVGPETLVAFPWALPGRFVELTVSDTGIGMSPETLAHIFEPFFTTKPEGTGLGLAVVYGIVKQSGGFITVESQLGKGSTFRVFLPLAPSEITGISSIPIVQDIQAAVPATILVVEEDERVRETLEMSLRRAGYKVVTASDGESALRIVEEGTQPVDLVISDVKLPGIVVEQLLERLHRLKAVPKIILMSGYAPDSADLEQLLSTHSVLFISKPFRIAEVLRKVRETLAR